MTLSTQHRAAAYTALAPLMGEDVADALMNEFPANEHDELVTKQFHRAESAMLRSELKAEIAELRTDMVEGFASVDVKLAQLRADLAEGLRRQTVWLASVLLPVLTLQISLIVALH